MGFVRTLVGQFKTAEAIHDHLAAHVVKVRTEPVTYNDLLAVLDAADVKELDADLSKAGLDWLQRQFAGSGADLSSEKIQAILTESLGKNADKVKAIGIGESLQWAEYGLPSLPSLAEVEAEIAPLVVDGRSMSVAVNVTPQRSSVAVSIHEMAGSQMLGQLESFATSQADDARLTAKQRALVAAVVALVNGY